MKRLTKTIDQLLLWAVMLLTVAWGMSSCSDDEGGAVAEDGEALELLTYTRALTDAPTTRAISVPSGYQLYTVQHPEAMDGSHVIGAYLTRNSGTVLRRFVYETNHWHSNAIVKEGESYYIYGFMPMSAVEESSISPVSDSYSNGANLTLEGLKSLSAEDVSVIVGVKGVENVLDDVEVTQGNFYYLGKGRDKNHVYLLFDHLYSAVQFSIRIDNSYSAMRTIRLKSVVLKTETAAEVDAHIELRPESKPIANVTFTSKGTTKGKVVLLDTERTLTTSYVGLGSLCYFSATAGADMKLVSCYDVYDRYGNLLRSNCISENRLNLLASMKRGERKNIQLTVNPTYLYQLSEPELDNPHIEVN